MNFEFTYLYCSLVLEVISKAIGMLSSKISNIKLAIVILYMRSINPVVTTTITFPDKTHAEYNCNYLITLEEVNK